MTQEEVKEVLCCYFMDCERLSEEEAYKKAEAAAAFMFAEGEVKGS